MLLTLRTILFLIFWGFIGYVGSTCLIGPLLIDIVGETWTKIITGTLAFTLIILYCMHKSRKTNQRLTTINDEETSKKSYLLVLSILALLMVPFGFAGMLDFRQGRELSPMWAGLLCLGIGFTLLYAWYCSKK